jgi:hypothetical protein
MAKDNMFLIINRTPLSEWVPFSMALCLVFLLYRALRKHKVKKPQPSQILQRTSEGSLSFSIFSSFWDWLSW